VRGRNANDIVVEVGLEGALRSFVDHLTVLAGPEVGVHGHAYGRGQFTLEVFTDHGDGRFAGHKYTETPWEVAASGAPTIQEKPDKAKQLKMRSLFTEDACSAALIWEYYETNSAEMVFLWENLPRSADEARFYWMMLILVLSNPVNSLSTERWSFVAGPQSVRSAAGAC
jgi:hypothetical protein